MSLSYGFYNSSGGDRRYDARQFSRLFNALIKDGVFMHIGSHFAVTEGSGMTVNVGTGYAWFNSTWTLNDAPLPVTAEQSDLLLTRIDALVLEINETVASRVNLIKFVKGTPSAQPKKPSLTNTNEIHQYALAYVTVNPGAESLTQSDIENNVGKEGCVFVTGILETIDISSLIAQWESQWNDWLNQQKKETDEFQKTSEEEFLEWFDHIKGQLGSDQAGNLQNQIDAIAPNVIYLYKAVFKLTEWGDSSPFVQTASVIPVDGGPEATENSKLCSGFGVDDSLSETAYRAQLRAATFLEKSQNKVLGTGTLTLTVTEKPYTDVEIYFLAKKGGI